MPSISSLTIVSAPSDGLVWRPTRERGPKLAPSGGGLTHTYETDTKALSECDWVRLSVVCSGYQIHPATVAELAALGPVGGANAQRWTVEGPTSHQPGDPGLGNCSIVAEIAYSLTSANPGNNWKPYRAGDYRLRSVKARIRITRPSSAYSFRILQLAIEADRIATPQRARRVASGVSDAIPAGMCRVVARDFEVAGMLEIEPDAVLEILA